MASAQYALSSLLTSHANGRTLRRIPVCSKRQRKNHLRPKIPRTQTKPYPLSLPLLSSPTPPHPVAIPQENNNLGEEIPSNETLAGVVAGVVAGESENMKEFQVSEVAARENGVFEKVSMKDIFKYGALYFLGSLVLQTIYAVWAIGNYKHNRQYGDLEIDGRESEDGKTVSLSVNDVSGEQLLMEEKIEEIRLMAKEARRLESEKKGEEDMEDEDVEIDDDERAVSSRRDDIEKEISERLINLQNRLNKLNVRANDINKALQTNASENFAAGMDRGVNKNMNEGDDALVFKKKFKFRSPSAKATKTPKGFPGTRNWKASDAIKKGSAGEETAQDYGSDGSDQAQMLSEDKQVNDQDADKQKSVSSVPLEERGRFVDDAFKVIQNDVKNLNEKMETPDMKTNVGNKTRRTDNGDARETAPGMSSMEVIQSRKSRDLSTQNSQGFVEENQDTGISFEKDGVHSVNGSSRHGLTEKRSPANRIKLKVKQADTETDLWWLNLRYVFVILMRRDSKDGSEGFYNIMLTSNEQDQSDDSFTVAFEDRADANNLCFLLQSFFEDLESFSADAVPVSIKELNEEILSHAKKVVVVKKRQLQLYAGQPLVDVEMALRAIIEQGQTVSSH
ncbi:hypothetical protein LR48_Vigan01g306000 [Vigna angularis]|uniref:Uncharacterized protein n=1 Tax=Phaseolus angularis TaxID=3914 RepID=A0A0L9TTM5_PHAAN|nr:hypothetical protein LR48_Vigan01g306000 [Vigna angularis]